VRLCPRISSCAAAHVIRLAQIAYQRAKLFLVRFDQLNIADIKRGGQRIAGTVNNAADPCCCAFLTSVRLSTLMPGGRLPLITSREPGSMAELFFKERNSSSLSCARHHETVLLAAGAT
jgi:hypothetical protein